jgi:hypothetical protein
MRRELLARLFVQYAVEPIAEAGVVIMGLVELVRYVRDARQDGVHPKKRGKTLGSWAATVRRR